MDADQTHDLERALATGADLSDGQLTLLTGLEGEVLRRFEGFWGALSPKQRTDLLERMGHLAIANLVLDFAPVYRLGLADRDPSVRATALWLAREEADPRLLDVYLDAGRADPDPEVRLAALASLDVYTLAAQTEDWPPEQQSRLERVLVEALHARNADAPSRRAALLSLAYLITPRSELEIRQAHLQPDLREAAILAMGRNCQDVWLDDLREELEAEDPGIRMAAALAAAEMEDERLVPGLIARIDDSDEDVWSEAIRALGVIGGAEAKTALSELLHARDRPRRDAAREALEEMLGEDDPLRGLSG